MQLNFLQGHIMQLNFLQGHIMQLSEMEFLTRTHNAVVRDGIS